MITDSTNLVDLDYNAVQSGDWTSLHELCRSQRKPPMLPATFTVMLQQKAFTNGESDMTFVAEKYAETFELNPSIVRFGCLIVRVFLSLIVPDLAKTMRRPPR